MDKEKKYEIFEDVYRQFVQGIFRFIYFKVSDYELARDLTADTFLRFWKQLSDGKKIQNDKAFLYFIAKGLIIDHYRRKKNRDQISIDSIDERLLPSIDDLEDKIDLKSKVDKILSKLQRIKKTYRDVLLLYYVEELEISQIAYVLKKKDNSVRVLIHRALKSLKSKL